MKNTLKLRTTMLQHYPMIGIISFFFVVYFSFFFYSPKLKINSKLGKVAHLMKQGKKKIMGESELNQAEFMFHLEKKI